MHVVWRDSIFASRRMEAINVVTANATAKTKWKEMNENIKKKKTHKTKITRK